MRLKSLTRSDGFRHVLSWMVASLLRLIYATGRWKLIGLERLAAARPNGEAVIGCFWHARMLLMPKLLPHFEPSYTLISSHRDGLMISETIGRLGIRTISGSSNRRASAAFRELVATIRRGHNVEITPDGPRGPRMRVQPGVIKLAHVTGAPIIPATASAKRRRLLKSWDRFMVIWPVNRGVIIIGEAIIVPRDADDAVLEVKRLEVEAALNAITAEADRLCGHPPVEPAQENPTAKTAHAMATRKGPVRKAAG